MNVTCKLAEWAAGWDGNASEAARRWARDTVYDTMSCMIAEPVARPPVGYARRFPPGAAGRDRGGIEGPGAGTLGSTRQRHRGSRSDLAGEAELGDLLGEPLGLDVG